MSRRWILIALATATAMLGAACGGGSGNSTAEASSTAAAVPTAGGTLRIALISDVQDAFDPQKEYSSVTWEYFRCCLVRTLLSYNGQTTDQGGSELRPDLAADMPTVSDDGLTWTFSLKPGIKYAPPLQDETVTSHDVVRALEREACGDCNVGGYSFYYSAIEGFDEFAAGDVDSISGLETPDDSTVVVTLNEPTGDLGYRLAMPASAPIPPLPGGRDARLGAATGHDADWGQFLVATGPYMFEGSEALDFTAPAEEQTPVAGYSPGRSIVLVRNPSWDATTDDLRPAYPDRIETTIGGTAEDIALKIDAGDMDLGLDAVPPANQVQQYTTDPDLQDRIHADPSDAVRFLEMNLANPPFDDIHIRKALNWALDKQGFLQLRGGPIFGEIAGHIMVNSLENNLLQTYDPYATPDGAGDIDKAKQEIALSRYDADGDGMCDAPGCKDVLTISDSADPYPKQLALLQQVLEPLGITLNAKPLERSTMYARCEDPNSHWALCTGPGWGKDYPDGFTFAPPLFSRSAIGPESCCNDTMVGVTPEMLAERDYAAVDVPSAEAQIERCIPLTGDERVQCWADLDTYLMEDVVPWVPYLFDNDVVVLSANVTNYSFDQFAGLPALDRLAVGSP
jgi:peptide/nickel transport system substrate-binding protein